jgi:hypothetical protein
MMPRERIAEEAADFRAERPVCFVAGMGVRAVEGTRR